MNILRSKKENQGEEKFYRALSADKRLLCWNQGQAGAKPGHDREGCGKRVRRAGWGTRASESVEGNLWLVCKHHSKQRGAEGQEQGAAAMGAPEGAEEERPGQQPENN